MPSIFISRPLAPNSPFYTLPPQWQGNGSSLLVFKPVAVNAIPEVDWLFFYSKRGVKYLLQQASPPSGMRLACLGLSAANALREAGYEPTFVGDGKPANTAEQWRSAAKDSRVAFVQARHSRASVQHLLGEAVVAFPLIVYDNAIRENIDIAPANYLIFTSPLNFQAYIQQYKLAPEQRIIGIGKTTAVTFSAASVKEYRIAKTPSEAGLLECLLAWEQESPSE